MRLKQNFKKIIKKYIIGIIFILLLLLLVCPQHGPTGPWTVCLDNC